MLLDDIITLATDDKQSITVLLRKCVVLAHQLKNERLKVWANKELNGYDPDDELPPYRTMVTIAKGNFSGFGGSQIRNREIPAAVLEERHQKGAMETPLIHAVGTYEPLSKGEGYVQSPWDPNLVLYYQQRIPIQGFVLVSAWQDIPTNAIAGMLDSIRTRVLNAALEIKTEVGESDADLTRVMPDSQEAKKVDQSIVNNIFGGNVYVASGHASMHATTNQQQQNIVVGDWEQLKKVLQGSGLADSEVEELSEAVKQDGGTMGSGVKGWISKNGMKVLSGGVKIGAAVGQSVLTAYLKQHFGLDQ
jgi:hypothetical protein